MSVRFNADEFYSATNAPVGTGNWTALCWGLVSVDRNAFSTFMSLDDSGGTPQTMVQTNSGGVVVTMYGEPASTTTVTPSGSTMTVGTWYKLAFKRSSSTLTVYFSNIAGTVTSATITLNGTMDIDRLKIGDSPVASEWLNGNIANFKLYDTALTQAEIVTEWDNWVAQRTTNLVRHHKFQTAAETTDYSGNGNSLSTTGSPTFEATNPTIDDSAPGSGPTDAAAGNAAVTVAANNAVGRVQPVPTTADLSVAGQSPSISVGASSIDATFGAAALDAAISVTPNAEEALLSVDGQSATQVGTVNAAAEEGLLSVAGETSAPTGSANAVPTTADLSVAGVDVIASVGAVASSADFNVDGADIFSAVSFVPDFEVTFQIEAESPGLFIESNAFPDVAALSAAAEDPSITRTANVLAEEAIFVAVAESPSTDVLVPTGSADLSVTAHDGTAAVAPTPEAAELDVTGEYSGDRVIFPSVGTLSVGAVNSTQSVNPVSEFATFGIDAENATPTSNTNTEAATAEFFLDAVDSEIISSGNTSVPAEVATLSVSGEDGFGKEEVFVAAFEADFLMDMPETTVTTFAESLNFPDVATFGVEGVDAGSDITTEPETAEISIESEAFAAVSPETGFATFSIDAQDTTTNSSGAFDAPEATFSLDGLDPSIASFSRTFVDALEAIFAVDAASTTQITTSNADAAPAEFNLDALDAIAGESVSVTPDTAGFSVNAEDAAPTNANNILATVATFSLAANNATSSLPRNVPADIAEFTMAAFDAVVQNLFLVGAEQALVGVSAMDAGVSVSTTPVTATFNLGAETPLTSIPPTAATIGPITIAGPSITPLFLPGVTIKSAKVNGVTVTRRET